MNKAQILKLVKLVVPVVLGVAGAYFGFNASELCPPAVAEASRALRLDPGPDAGAR